MPPSWGWPKSLGVGMRSGGALDQINPKMCPPPVPKGEWNRPHPWAVRGLEPGGLAPAGRDRFPRQIAKRPNVSTEVFGSNVVWSGSRNCRARRCPGCRPRTGCHNAFGEGSFSFADCQRFAESRGSAGGRPGWPAEHRSHKDATSPLPPEEKSKKRPRGIAKLREVVNYPRVLRGVFDSFRDRPTYSQQPL